MNPVAVTFDERVKKWYDHEIDGGGYWQDKTIKPGAISWSYENELRANLSYACPCGCGYICSLTVMKDHTVSQHVWNGDKEKPTITPSILQYTPCRWHGFLTNGEFVTC